MNRGQPSGYSLGQDDVRVVLGMQARGDRNHDIAAWFGVNQGRVAEAKDGKFGTVEAAKADELPPSGPPGIKGRRMRAAVEDALSEARAGRTDEVIAILEDARARYDANEV